MRGNTTPAQMRTLIKILLWIMIVILWTTAFLFLTTF